MKEAYSDLAQGIINGLTEVLDDVRKKESKLKTTTVYTVDPKAIRLQLNMSQREFADSFGIPIGTLRNWEQGTRKIDNSSMAYLRTIMKYPNEAMAAQL